MTIEPTPIEALDRNILDLGTRINAATNEMLVMICEFDRRILAPSQRPHYGGKLTLAC